MSLESSTTIVSNILSIILFVGSFLVNIIQFISGKKLRCENQVLRKELNKFEQKHSGNGNNIIVKGNMDIKR